MALIRRISTGQAFSTKEPLAECAKPGIMQGSVASVYESTSRFGNAADPLKARKQKVPAVHEGKSEGGCPYFGSCGYKMEMCKDAAPENV